MSPALISLFFSLGVAGFVYMKLVQSTGNAVPRQNYIGAAITGVMTYIVIFTFLKYIIHFE